MKAHIYEPKVLPGVELGAGALYLGEPTEDNKICDVMPGAYAQTRQDKTGEVNNDNISGSYSNNR